jgi:hypothetical protein
VLGARITTHYLLLIRFKTLKHSAAIMGVLDESENHTPLSTTQQQHHHRQQPCHDIEGAATPQSASPTPVLYHQDDDDDDDHPDGDDETPFLSVLNTVVDQIMMDPTPLLEPKEFEQQIPVPVLRVFGPIVRDASLPDDGELKQSACLYIHGAYPYLLARPVLAGPDGSSTSASSGGHIDWDSVASVESILPQLQIALEGMIVASLENNNFGNNAKKGTSTTQRVIRQITLVVGRGFYTYCPGPAAPFLRVEYYNPKLRWKVKQSLERGLDHLPLRYHPHPKQYNMMKPSTSTTAGDNDDDAPPPSSALVFSCYEAHIPYTMQFFKDYNLAGMSYIHISGSNGEQQQQQQHVSGKFRVPLPKSVRRRTKASASATNEGDDGGNSALDEDSLFLQHNTDARHVWSSSGDGTNDDGTVPMSYDSRQGNYMRQSSSMEDNDAAANRSSQESTFGATATTKAKVNKMEQQRKRRREEAVWRKKETSCDVEYDCTVEQILNVRTVLTSSDDDSSSSSSVHWRAVPSLREIWRQERRRMAKLLPPKENFLSPQKREQPPSFTLSVKRNASLPGARLAVLGMKKLFRVSMGLEQEFTRVMKQIIERYADQVQDTDRSLLLLASSITKQTLLSSSLTQESTTSSHTNDDAVMEALAALGGQFVNDDQASKSKVGSEGDKHVDDDCRQEYPGSQAAESPPVLSQIPDEEYEETAQAFSQRVDRGENVEDSYNGLHVEDYIDPATLVPYDDDDDEEDDEEHMDEEAFEQSLTMLASQMETETRKKAPPIATVAPYREQVDWAKLNDSFDSDDDGNLQGNTLEPILEETPVKSVALQPIIEDTPLKNLQPTPKSLQSPTLVARQFSSSEPKNIAGKCFTLADAPPSRAEVESREVSGTNSRYLHPLERHRATPTWLPNATNYMSSRGDLVARGMLASTWGPRQNEGDFSIVPVTKPPSRKAVESWCHKQQAKSSVTSKKEPSKQLESKGRGHPSKFAGVNLQIDDNSRKFTAVGQKRKRVEFKEGGSAQEVEEVEWVNSQPIQSQSQSQQKTPRKADMPAPTPIRNSVSSFDENPQSASSASSQLTGSVVQNESQESKEALAGIGQQGGRIYIEGGGGLKSKTNTSPKTAGARSCHTTPKRRGISSLELPTPLTIMSIEAHIQCRSGRAGVNDSKEIAMRPNPDKDKVSAIVYIYAKDPGGGEAMQILERGCLFVPVEAELKDKSVNAKVLSKRIEAALPRATMGVTSDLVVEAVRDERQLLLRLASIVRWKDPDMLLSWDPQGVGLGYIIERGAILGKAVDPSRASPGKKGATEVDLTRLLGRLPTARKEADVVSKSFFDGERTSIDAKEIDKPKGETGGAAGKKEWKGSGLGTDWDERVGAGAAAASIVSWFFHV